MLNEFAGIWKVSDESLGQDETLCASYQQRNLNSSQIFDIFLLHKKKKEPGILGYLPTLNYTTETSEIIIMIGLDP